MCAAMLIEEGKLDLEGNVSSYLPDLALPDKGRELRVQDLLWHTSSLPNFINRKEQLSIAAFKEFRGFTFLTNETHSEWWATMQPLRAPSAEYQYTHWLCASCQDPGSRQWGAVSRFSEATHLRCPRHEGHDGQHAIQQIGKHEDDH
jgi:hypothetical protein